MISRSSSVAITMPTCGPSDSELLPDRVDLR